MYFHFWHKLNDIGQFTEKNIFDTVLQTYLLLEKNFGDMKKKSSDSKYA